MRVKFFGILRDEVGSAAISLPARKGDSVGDVLQCIAERYPQTRRRLFAPDGSLQPFVMISLSGTDIRHAGGLNAPVSQRDELLVFPPGAGG